MGDHAKGQNMFAPSMTLERRADVRDVWTNSLNRVSDTRMGTKNAFPAAEMPPLPLATTAGQGTDVTVEHGKRRSLTPGTYGLVTLEHHSKLELAPGKYIFVSVRMEEESEWAGEHGPVDAQMVQGLWMGRHAKIGPHFDDAKAKDFTIEVAGSDPTTVQGTTRLTPTTVLSIGKEARIHALLAAPHGTVWMAEDAEVKGAIAAFDIVVGARTHAELESGFAVSAPGRQGSQQLHGYYGLHPDPSVAPLMGAVPADTAIEIAIGLPVRNPKGLKTFIKAASDPTSSTYRKYLTQAQFYATYGATNSDYQALDNWAKQSSGFTVGTTYPNNLLLSVTGTAAQIEKALYVNLVYRLRKDGSKFVTVDREPSLDLAVPILEINGLDDFVLPHSSVNINGTGVQGCSGGSNNPQATNDCYAAADIRNAYLGVGSSCSILNGTGQVIGIIDYATFDPTDIAGYDNAQIPPINPNVTVVATQGGLSFTQGNSALEATLDVEMVQAMAPNATILFFQGNPGITGHMDDTLHAMATSNPPLNVASSSLATGGSNNSQQALAEMAAQEFLFSPHPAITATLGTPTAI